MKRWWPRSLAGQVFTVHVVAVLVLVVTAGSLAAYDARRDGDRSARDQVRAVAVALADAPSTAAAIESGTATAQLQPVTEQVRDETSLAFITIMSPDRVRFTHTNPAMIGGRFVGTIAPALAGRVFTETYTGTLGPSVRAVAPVRDRSGRVIGLVAAGITTSTLAQRWLGQLPVIVAITVAALVASLVGVWAMRRRLLRQTHGLAPEELRVMYEHHDAVLHAVNEGLVVVDDGAVALVNDEARRLLGLGDGPVRLADVPEFVSAAADPDVDPESIRDEVHVTGERVLVVNRSSVHGPRGTRSAVITVRDRTELQGALGELDSLRVFAESLRSQAHESANRLHTVVGLVEMGRPADAVRFATTELQLSQHLVDRLTAAVAEPALVALLLGKSAQAHERGIALAITEETQLDPPSDSEAEPALSGSELVTVAGNLIDNALDACDRADPWVEVTVRQDATELVIRVADSGPGMDPAELDRARRRGYSTKAAGPHGGRGLGLALVSQVVSRHGGSIGAEMTYGSVVTVRVPR
ncbi:sensor histidine kinase [Williamsia sp. CHRR-6]|uniref:sensor histidine kinase n=1 Tax=Williamsia sp. CHRR-6 TaxID=2835871 RepID=UPI001BDA5439|nr:sensor histidine kinase [Williamsia sp. CHRR-6]MBT0567434.1 sensor histidine kinase [Williamsia sp. CHRR-6]